MQKYVNLTSASTITHYEIGDEYIRIWYKKKVLEYRASTNSKETIEHMKLLAKQGSGLSRYIMKNKIQEERPESSIYQRLKSIILFK